MIYVYFLFLKTTATHEVYTVLDTLSLHGALPISDLAATLLSALGLPHQEYTFSRNLLCPNYTEYAFYTYPNGFGFIDSTGVTVFDNEGLSPLIEQPETGSETRIQKGKALLQTLYDDLGKR